MVEQSIIVITILLLQPPTHKTAKVSVVCGDSRRTQEELQIVSSCLLKSANGTSTRICSEVVR